jgi:hypothetical protein
MVFWVVPIVPTHFSSRDLLKHLPSFHDVSGRVRNPVPMDLLPDLVLIHEPEFQDFSAGSQFLEGSCFGRLALKVWLELSVLN